MKVRPFENNAKFAVPLFTVKVSYSYNIWRCILFSAFSGSITPPNQVHRLIYICKGTN